MKLFSILSVSALAALSFFTSTASAATITLATTRTGPAVAVLNTRVGNGNATVLLGTFSVVPSSGLTGADALAFTISSFSQFGASALTASTQTGDSKAKGVFTDNTAAFNSKALYVVVYTGTSLATATNIGIFRAVGTPAVGDLWAAPADNTDNSATASFDGGSINTAYAGSISAPPASETVATSYLNLVSTAAVPEPSSLAFLGLLGALGFRRKR